MKVRRKRAEESSKRFIPVLPDVHREYAAQCVTRQAFRNYYAIGWQRGYEAGLRDGKKK